MRGTPGGTTAGRTRDRVALRRGSGGLRLATAAARQLAGREVDRAAADRHVRARLVRRDRPLHRGTHGRDLLGGIELDRQDVLVTAQPAERLADLVLALERRE